MKRTAISVVNNTYGDRITCEAIGVYTLKGTCCVMGAIWRDPNGGLWYLSRFSRKYIFYPFTNNDDKYDIYIYD